MISDKNEKGFAKFTAAAESLGQEPRVAPGGGQRG